MLAVTILCLAACQPVATSPAPLPPIKLSTSATIQTTPATPATATSLPVLTSAPFSTQSPTPTAITPTTHQPDLFLLDQKTIVGAKQRVSRNAPELVPVIEKLRRDADSALKAGPFSVMNKKGTPPGGDKHDYLSLSIYYWPDPAKADGKPYIVRDGEINPESKTDFYDKSSLDGMLSAVKTLSLAYYFTGEEKYGIQAANLLRTWFISPATRMNPNMDYSQGIPGKPGSRASGIIESVGFLAMLDYPALLTGLKEWTPADQLALQTWFLSYLNWLQTSPTGKAEAAAKNNHGAWYDAQTAMYALFSGDLGTASSVLKTSTPARIAAQIEPDGRQPLELARTRSLHYSLYNLQAFINQAVMGQKTESNLWRYSTPDGRSIRKALDFVLPYLNGQKWEYPEMGTQDYTDFAPYLYLAGAAYNEKSYTALADTLLGSDLRSSRLKLLYAR